jgi:hypothetical protein
MPASGFLRGAEPSEAEASRSEPSRFALLGARSEPAAAADTLFPCLVSSPVPTQTHNAPQTSRLEAKQKGHAFAGHHVAKMWVRCALISCYCVVSRVANVAAESRSSAVSLV